MLKYYYYYNFIIKRDFLVKFNYNNNNNFIYIKKIDLLFFLYNIKEELHLLILKIIFIYLNISNFYKKPFIYQIKIFSSILETTFNFIFKISFFNKNIFRFLLNLKKIFLLRKKNLVKIELNIFLNIAKFKILNIQNFNNLKNLLIFWDIPLIIYMFFNKFNKLEIISFLKYIYFF